MASSSGSTHEVGQPKVLDPGCGMDELSEVLVSEYVTAHATDVTESALGSPSRDSFLSAQCESIDGGLEIESLGACGESRVKEEIERSKQHWSLLVDPFESDEDGEGVVAEVDNVEVFKTLQKHPTWGHFFQTLHHDVGGTHGTLDKLELGEKFAEGGQGELFHAQVLWKNANFNKWDLKHGMKWVLKVFKEGTFLRDIIKQLPQRYLQFKEEERINWKSSKPKQFPRYYCEVKQGILLEDGRFAFLMVKQSTDLRILIEEHLKLSSSENCGPFSHDDAEWLMYKVAVAVKWLHELGIVHRDLKAANVLVHEYKSGWPKWFCYVADYECSIGVVGTRFFRAPEILQALKDRKLNQRPEVFSKAADVYSYGMTCYEILTGKLPFEGQAFNDYDVVLCGPQLEVPVYVDGWTKYLLKRCWELNPLIRPSMEEIVKLFLDHSPRIRVYEEGQSEHFRKLNQ